MRRGCRVAGVVLVTAAVALVTSRLLAAAAPRGLGPPAGAATAASALALGPGSCPGGAPAPALSCQVGTVLTQVAGAPAGHGGAAPVVPPPGRAAPAAAGVSAPPGIPPPPSAVAIAPPPLPQLSPDVLGAIAQFGNEPFLQSLLAAVGHPAAGRPDLRHLDLADGAGAPAPGAAAGTLVAAASTDAAAGEAALILRLLLAALLAATAVLVTVAVAGLRRGDGVTSAEPGPSSRRRSWPVAAVALTGAVASAGLVVSDVAPVGALVRSVVALDPTDPAGRQVGDALDHPLDGDGVLGDSPWRRLVAVEGRLAGDRQRTTVLDGEMRRIVGSGAEAVGLDRLMLQPSRIARLVASREEAAADDRAGEEAEYLLYRGAAGDPAQRLALLQGAATMSGGAVSAVTDDLQLVDTQLGQERAIAQAEATLSRYGALSPAQLDGMSHRQPFIAPETASLTQPFGPTDLSIEPPLTYQGIFHPHFHTGIDLAGPLRTQLHAAADGVVPLAATSVDPAGRLVGYGNYVVIGHAGGFVTLYAHLDSVAVRAGDVVRQGQVIGLEGSTGWSTGPHVHFEVRRGEELLDPLQVLSASGR
jgi:murein DD-endopeptidase MepM/ murein hydrolase activator NlpD